MRSLILRQPPPTAQDSLPSCYAERIDEASLREWLAHPAARRELRAQSYYAQFANAVAEAFDIPNDQGGVLVAYVAGAALVTDEDFDALGHGQAFDDKERADDEALEQLIDAGREALGRSDHSSAIAHLKTAHDSIHDERSARHADVLVMLSRVAENRGKQGDAASLLDWALTMAPTNPAALGSRARVASVLGEAATRAAMISRLADAEAESEIAK